MVLRSAKIHQDSVTARAGTEYSDPSVASGHRGPSPDEIASRVSAERLIEQRGLQ